MSWTAVLIERAVFAATVLGLPRGSRATPSDGHPDGGGGEGDEPVAAQQAPAQAVSKKRRQQ